MEKQENIAVHLPETHDPLANKPHKKMHSLATPKFFQTKHASGYNQIWARNTKSEVKTWILNRLTNKMTMMDQDFWFTLEDEIKQIKVQVKLFHWKTNICCICQVIMQSKKKYCIGKRPHIEAANKHKLALNTMIKQQKQKKHTDSKNWIIISQFSSYILYC